MTKERLEEIRNAVGVLSKLSEEEWKRILLENEGFNLQVNDEDNIEKKIYNIFKTLGIRVSVRGSNFLKEAICIVLQDDTMLSKMTTCLYPKIAEKFNTTGSRVERTIRHSIETAYDIGNTEEWENVFGNTISPFRGKPTNKEFIAQICIYLKLYM